MKKFTRSELITVVLIIIGLFFVIKPINLKALSKEIIEFLFGFFNESPLGHITQSERDVPEVRQVDVVVIGGNPAGVSAALAAARNGAKVLLIEKEGFFGGNATAGLFAVFQKYKTDREQVINGIFDEILSELIKYRGYQEPAFDPEKLKVIFDNLLTHPSVTSKIELLLHTQSAGVVMEDNTITGVVVENKSGRQIISAKIVIDATETADIAAFAGVPYSIDTGNEAPPASFCFIIGKVTASNYPSEIIIPQRNGLLGGCLQLYPTVRPNEVLVVYSRKTAFNGVNLLDLSQLYGESLLQMVPIRDYLRRNIQGFENCCTFESAVQLLMRPIRHIQAEYTLTEADVRSCKQFEDVVARNAYGIEIYYPDGRIVTEELPAGKAYDIPYRCLIPRRVENLIIASCGISATKTAASSLNNIPVQFAIGQAAGTAAGLCVVHNVTPRALDVRLLQLTLMSQGANLHNLTGIPPQYWRLME